MTTQRDRDPSHRAAVSNPRDRKERSDGLRADFSPSDAESTEMEVIDHTPWYQRTSAIVGTVVALLTLFSSATYMAWNSSAILTGVRSDIAGLRSSFAQYQVSAQQEQSDQINALSARITSLETSRSTDDQQIAATTAAIAGLQAQTQALQGSISDLKGGINQIQQDLNALTRAANVPIRTR